MILLVDVGNTRLKWRCYDPDSAHFVSGTMVNEEVGSQKIQDDLLSLPVDVVYFSSVGRADIYIKIKHELDLEGKEIYCVEVQKEMLGLHFVYERIERLGVDRAMAMLGAFDKKGVLIVDAGSAITADYVSDDGVHLGGFILPGLAMTQSLLYGKTAKVGVKASLGNDKMGVDTESCVNNGFTVLIKSLMQGLQERANELGIYRCVLTGGDAHLFESIGCMGFKVEENLVLDGLFKYALEKESLSGVLE